MTLYFHSPNPFPIEVLSILGLSAKVTDQPIGRFGTGLKYAIAGTLRLGGSVILRSGEATYTFSTRTASLRGQEYQSIYMHGPAGETLLPFTLSYGRDWHPWQLYREFFSNCLDEGGDVSREPVRAQTIFIVEGLDDVDHASIFLPKGKPLFAADTAEIYDRPTTSLFYRGIRVRDLDKPSRYTINFLNQMQLNEDRLVTYEGTGKYYLTQDVLFSSDEDFIRFACTTPDIGNYLVPYSFEKTGDTFLSVAEEEKNLLPAFESLFNKMRKNATSMRPIEITPEEEEDIRAALDIIRPLFDEPLRGHLVYVVEHMNGAWGLTNMRERKIYIARACFDEGRTFLAQTLFEEFSHLLHDLADESREFQEYLLRRLIRTQIRLQAAERKQ